MALRDWLPWRDLVIETSWPPGVAAIELRKRIEPPQFIGRGDAPFVGTSTSAMEFQFSAGSSRRNSLLTIQAAVEPSRGEGALVQIRMRPPFGVTFFGMVAVVPALMFGATAGGPAGFVALAIPTFVSGLFAIGFARQARQVETSLREIFAVAPGRPTPPETGLPYR